MLSNGVTYRGEVYAVPISYYHWGILYKKSVIEQFGGVPSNWDAFVRQCRKIKEAGLTPIGLGAADAWPAAAWFDYLDLRMNGLSFHEQLLSGKIPFTDKRVAQVFVEWKKLVDVNAYNADYARIDWDAVFPYMYRDKIAYTLIGSFAYSKLPKQMMPEIGFMPFPRLKPGFNYEEAPLDVLLIPRQARHVKLAKQFLTYMARADVQSNMNTELGFLSPNKASVVGNNVFSRAGQDLLRQSQGVAQYFDRDTVPDFEKKAMPLLVRFVGNGNIEEAIAGLERARLAVFK